jgi:hypothetical protein
MRKTTFLAAVLIAALAWARPAAADTILFDTDGSGGGGGDDLSATLFDWLPGNALLIEDATGTTATILFQANLGVIQTTSGIDYANCTDGAGSCFTIVAYFDVTLTPDGSGGTNITLIPNSGELKIYADDERGDNLTGTGFTDGTEILSATLTNGSGSFAFSSFTPVSLDQFLSAVATEPAGNNYPNAFTFTGEGGAQFTATVDSFLSSYFINLTVGSSLVLTDTSQIDPFTKANPSDAFSTDGVADGDYSGVISGNLICGAGIPGGPSCVNGTGTNIIVQSDASSVFTLAPPQVPEPATLSLLGLGLLGSAALRRRQLKKKKNQQ